MLQHGAGVCQGENSHDHQKCLNAPSRELFKHAAGNGSSLDEHGITSKRAYNRELREKIGEELLKADMLTEFWKWDNCQRSARYFKCLECGEKFYIPFRCDLRICPECNGRYFMQFKARYLGCIRQLLKRRKRGHNWLSLLTVTTKNTGEMPSGEEIKAHNKAIGALIKKYFKGGVSVNEVKGTYLHSHCIVYGPYVPHSKLSKEWEALTGNKVVDIRAIKEKTRDVVNYIGKYIKKPYHLENNEQGYSLAVSFLKNFKGVRRVHSFGVFYAIKPEPRKPFVCPYCGSADLLLLSRSENDMTVTECQITGTLSYKQVLRAWDTPINQGLCYATA